VLEGFSVFIHPGAQVDMMQKLVQSVPAPVIAPTRVEITMTSSKLSRALDTPQSVVTIIADAVAVEVRKLFSSPMFLHCLSRVLLGSQMNHIQLSQLFAILSGMSAFTAKTTAGIDPLPIDSSTPVRFRSCLRCVNFPHISCFSCRGTQLATFTPS
jgi:hypothetical protein